MVPDAMILAAANVGFGLSLSACWYGPSLAGRVGQLGMLAAFLAVQVVAAPAPQGPVQRLYTATATAILESGK